MKLINCKHCSALVIIKCCYLLEKGIFEDNIQMENGNISIC